MEVVAAPSISTSGTPFRDHDVREWSRINSITGALERARLETDSWSASTRDASHKYGKVVDSRARTGADGSLQAQASRQFEVFQSRAAGARLQVVKTKTVSSSRWSGKGDAGIHGLGFEDLQLPLNPLDISFEKSKASLGRSVGRRPPTRQPRSQNLDTHFTAAANLHRVSRLCHQVHESAVRNAFGRKSSPSSKRNSIDSSTSGVEITELASSVNSSSDNTLHSNLTRTKSTSSDDIHQIPEKDTNSKSTEDLDDLEQLQTWQRTSKIRRSLQYPKTSSPTASSKPIDLPKNIVSVKKIREDLEKGKRLTTALRNNSGSVDLDALDQIIQSISSSSSIDKSSVDDNLEDHESEYLISKRTKKRDSFVTVKSLQEVKERLRRTSSPGSEFVSSESKSKDEDSDDGIVTEESNAKTSMSNKIINQSKVKSYIYGMESMLQNKKPVLGTGSLESRSKLVNGSASHKSEDWYNRRKSYGFEKVHGQEEPSSNSLKNKNVAESSTDSGICRSSEIMVVPMATKTNTNNRNISRFNSDSESDVDSSYNSHNKSHNGINYGNVKKMTSIFNQVDKNLYYNKSSDGLTNTRNKRPLTLKENEWKKSEIKSTTITIPIVKNNNVVDLAWNDELEKDLKRHSIAVDEAKYATNSTTDNRFRKTSLVMNDQYLKNDNTTDDDNLNNKKPKKVLFCKTEVHFAADSGKVNIVETDEKPPPTQNFRRRRRNSGPITDLNENFNQNGLPVLHFGDSSYEKTMFGINDEDTENKDIASNSANIYENIQVKESRVPSAFSVVTVNTNNNTNHNSKDEERRDCAETDNIKGILKNKPIKPKPYHLGETAAQDSNSDEDSRRWGVRLRHVPKDNPPIWKSTVTVHNSYYDNQDETNNDYEQSTNNQTTEFRKLLRNLRPTKKPDYLSDNENRYSDSFASIRVVPAVKDNRRSSWSVADKVKLVDDVQESKLYSTKVNFGDGKAIVVQNDQSTWPRTENLTKENSEDQIKQDFFVDSKKPNATYNKYSIHSSNSKFSPVVLRKTIPITTEPRDASAKHQPVNGKSKMAHSLIRNTESSIEVDDNRRFLAKEYKNIPDSTLQSKYTSENIVLRQPKKSEMTYFGVNVSPQSSKRTVQTAVIKKERKLTEKQDLTQYHRRSPSPENIKSRWRSPENNRNTSASPIYENLKHIAKTNQSKYSSSNKDFDSSILDELTKAADQILQAVNGYTDEDCHNRLSSDEEEPKKPLDTISETKSWKNSAQNIEIKNQQRMRPTLASAAKVRVKRTSSTSSVESLSRDKRKNSLTERKSTTPALKAPSETSKNKVVNDHSSAKASTKARRLQRASSREALLQSHGSSSEDLPTNIEAPVRKPRLVKKTKAAQLTITNGMELKKPTRKSREEKSDNSRSSERMLGGLSEIRHKTAISTITTTAEKSSRDKSRDRSRDRSKTRGEESKVKNHTRRESSSKGTMSSSSTRPTSSTSRSRQQYHSQRTTTSSKESGGVVTQHRISTANIKKCHRSEGASKH